jgi:hypothetical protein
MCSHTSAIQWENYLLYVILLQWRTSAIDAGSPISQIMPNTAEATLSSTELGTYIYGRSVHTELKNKRMALCAPQRKI